MIRALLILVLCLAFGLPALAHHPDPKPGDRKLQVVARVPISNPSQLKLLQADHELWGFAWRLGYAEILTEESRLPAGARIDWAATARWRGEQTKQAPEAIGTGTIPGFACYRTVEKTYADLSTLASQHPGLAQWIDYGDSWLKQTQAPAGYDLNVMVLTNQFQTGPKPVLMIMAAMHPRELTTAETATRLAEWLVDGYGVDADITWLLDYTEIHIMPQQNPDGRKQAEAGSSWRKNVNENFCSPTSLSRGVDLNRNASTLFWGGPAASEIECSLTFRGPAPASEPESAAIEAWLTSRFPDQRDGDLSIGAPEDAEGIFISMHSFGEYVFYPWEGDNIDTGNETGYQALSQRLASITGYAACQNCCIGTASGTTVDFAYEELGVASFTFELGTSFAQDCASFESTIWPDNREALLYAAKAARRPYQSSLGPIISDIQQGFSGDSANLLVTADASGYAVNNTCAPIDPTVVGSPVASVELSIDQPPWLTGTQTLIAQDGSFDELQEVAIGSLTSAQIGSGRHMVFLRAIDSQGRAGPPSAVYLEFPSVFRDGFESDLVSP